MIKSPCVNVCHMSPPRGVCVGCCRTLQEIARWSEMTDAERDAVIAELPRRRAALGLPAPAQAARD
ncbi:MAG: DUF1289 domain-containing protein [Betaproteobacteria bacterium]|nr:DUF1289 domain-containing protein [Betaproteobacteria bacterium]